MIDLFNTKWRLRVGWLFFQFHWHDWERVDEKWERNLFSRRGIVKEVCKICPLTVIGRFKS